MTKKAKRLLQILLEVLQWRIDVEDPEMIESKAYTKTYLAIQGGISSGEMHEICTISGLIFRLIGSKLRVSWHAGEFIPYTEKKL